MYRPEKLSSNAYKFDLTLHGAGGVTITLTQVETGKTKVFWQAGARDIDGAYNHMCSLTDSQCEQWFNTGDRKKKSKDTKEQRT